MHSSDEDLENRGCGEVTFEPSDFFDTPLESDKPPQAPQFHAAIQAAARGEAKVRAASESRAIAAEIHKLAVNDAKAKFRALADTNPNLGRYALNSNFRAVLKRPPGYWKEPSNIVLGWLEIPKTALKRTDKEVVKSLNERYQGHSIPKDFMSLPLGKWQKKHILSLLRRHSVKADMTDCGSLSAIKQRIKDHLNPPEYETFKPVLKFAKDGSHLIWNGKRYSIFMNGRSPSIKRNGSTIAVSAIRKVVAR